MRLALEPKLSLSQRLVIKCKACQEPMDDHAEGCLVKFLEGLKQNHGRCPDCDGLLGVNSNDMYECRKCHTQFTILALDVTKENFVILDLFYPKDMEQAIRHGKGTGIFPVDNQIEMINTSINNLIRDRMLERRKNKC